MISKKLSIRFIPRIVIPDDAKQAIIKSNSVNFFSFMRCTFFRLFSFFLAIILCFNVVCKPKEVEAAATGMVVLTTTETISLVSTILGFAIPSIQWWLEQYKDYKNNSSATEQDLVDYVNSQITVDGDGNYVLTDDAMLFINATKEAYEAEVTYQNAYFIPPEHINASFFNNRTAYTLVCNLIKNHPDKGFLFLPQTCEVVNYDDNGNKTNSSYLSGVKVFCFNVPYAGVSASGMSVSTSKVTMFEEDWTSDFECICFHVLNTSECGFIQYVDADGVYHRFEDLENPFDLSAVDWISKEAISAFMGISSNFYEVGVIPNSNYVFSAFAGSIPVFKTVSDMKNGTAGGTAGQFMPNYAPGAVTDNSVTQTEITEYNTNYNYYYGSGGGSGSGDSDTDSSGDGFLNGLLGALGKFGNAILGILTKLLDFLTKGIQLVMDSFLNVADIVDNGFVDLLTAIFPYVPKEWISVVTIGLGLTLFGVIIRLFTK